MNAECGIAVGSGPNTTPPRVFPFRRRGLAVVAAAVLAATFLPTPASAVAQQPKAVDASSPAAGLAAAPTSGRVDWTQFGGNASHSNVNSAETTISRTTIARLAPAFVTHLAGVADGPPAYLTGVKVGATTRDVLFAETTDAYLHAVDATSGQLLWTSHDGAGSCRINNGSSACYTTSQPAVDPNRLYVYSYGLDGYVHKRKVGDGTEIRGGGWPALATRKAYDEKSSPNLTIVSTEAGGPYLYVANGGYPGDRGDYQGHVTVINLGTGAQKVFNTLCSNQTVHFTATTPDCPAVQSAVWARGSVTYDPAQHAVFFTTGNSTFRPSTFDWGDTVLKIKPDGSGVAGAPLDTYTPSNQLDLNAADLDLGSTAPTLIPTPAGSTVTDLGVQSGKDSKLRLLDMGDLSGQHGPGHSGGELQIVDVPQGGQVLTQPVAWKNPATGRVWLFVANRSGLSGLEVTVAGGHPSLTRRWQLATSGTTPVVAGGMLFYLTANGTTAVDPGTGAKLWNDGTSGTGVHWQSPIVVNGSLYYTDGHGDLRAYRVMPAAPHRGFNAVTARRVLDSRSGSPVGAGATISIPIAGRAGVPSSGVAMVAVNLTVVNARTGGYLVAYAGGRSKPATSNLNFAAGRTAANLALVPVGDDGTIRVVNGSAGTVDVLADVTGYVIAAAGTPGIVVPVAPARVFDTAAGNPVAAGATSTVPVTGRGGVPAGLEGSVLVHLTAAGPRSAGFLTARPAGSAGTGTSSVNFAAGQAGSNLDVIAVGTGGAIAVTNHSPGSVRLIVDVVGYVPTRTSAAAGTYAALPGTRLFDSRSGSPVPASGSASVTVAGRGGVPASGAVTAVVNLTVTGAARPGSLAAYPSGTTAPSTSSVNFDAARSTANLALVPVGTDGRIVVDNSSPGTIDVIVDVIGYFYQ